MNDMKQYPASETVTVNGITLHCAVAGEGDPIVLIHGNGEDHHIFGVEIGQLIAAGYKVYAPDSRGHGANDPLPEYHILCLSPGYRKTYGPVKEVLERVK